jgi:heme oxygenase
MLNPGWMLTRLARETRAHHAIADGDRLELMNATSLADYRSQLLRIYSFEAAVERALPNLAGTQLQVTHYRERLARLRDDLVALGMNVSELEVLPRCTSIAVRSPAHAFGWLFVVERNALLAGLIRRYLASQLPELERTAVSYLDAASDHAGPRLRTLGDVLGLYARREPGAPEAVIAAARVAFQQQHHWYARVARVSIPSQTSAVAAQRQPRRSSPSECNQSAA